MAWLVLKQAIMLFVFESTDWQAYSKTKRLSLNPEHIPKFGISTVLGHLT